MIKRIYILIFSLFFSSCIYAQGQTSAEISKEISKAMDSRCGSQEFSGVILIAIHGQITLKKACGLASREFNVPNQVDTKFNLGSIGKLFTSVAIVQLIQQHKLSLQTPVDTIIPSWLPKDSNSKLITVGQLLIHASGLGNFMEDERWKLGADSSLYKTVTDYKPLIQQDHLRFKPGTSQVYSNNGYLLLGAIIEKITHMNYSDYFKKFIFVPAMMSHTDIWSLDEIVPNRSIGYFKTCDTCSWQNNNYQAPFIGTPAGGAYSTAEDLFNFSESLHHAKLFSPQFSHEILVTNVTTVSKNTKIKSYQMDGLHIPERFSAHGFAGAWNKYGFAVWENPSLVGHTGGTPGASAFFATSPDGNYTIIILANVSGVGPVKLYTDIRKILGFPGTITNY